MDLLRFSATLPGALARLVPLTSVERRRYLFVARCGGEWTAYFDNGRTGSDISSKIGRLALRVRCRGVRAVCQPHTARRQEGQWRGQRSKRANRVSAGNDGLAESRACHLARQ